MKLLSSAEVAPMLGIEERTAREYMAAMTLRSLPSMAFLGGAMPQDWRADDAQERP